MSELHALVTSDWHFGGLASLYPVDHISRQIREIHKIYSYAIRKGIKNIIVPGDVSDTPFMDYGIHAELISLLLEYDDHINTYYIAGNHDFSNKKKTSMDFLKTLSDSGLFKNFKLCLEPEQLRVDGVLLNLIPYPSKESIRDGTKEPALNFVHTELPGVVGDNGREIKSSKEFSRPRRDFTISGHIHKYQKLEKQRAIYCGNPYQKNFGEALPKGFIEIRASVVGKFMVVKHRFIDNKPGYTLQQVVINDVSDFSNLLDSSDSIRYKVYVSEDVFVPEDLRIRYPNIHNILSLSGAKAEVLVQELSDNKSSTISTDISLTKGLKPMLKKQGLTRKEILQASDIVDSAISELGLMQ